ncbi:MAG TPA: RNA methyltransferase [Ktedonobacteraceae bacterium]|nr:RNA methyltransferase [Ktedonobacteraceae bacterium]
MTLITSPSNPRIVKVRALHTTCGRKKNSLFLMEGPNLLEALLAAQIVPHEIYYQPELLRRTARGASLLDHLLQMPTRSDEHLIEVSERVIESISETQTSQGIVCVLPLNALDHMQIQARRMQAYRPALLILDALTDPGNMGTILRTALAADVERVLLTPDCVDYYSPKVLRAAAGAHLMLLVETDLSWAAIGKRVAVHCGQLPHVLLAEASSPTRYYDLDLTQPFALIIGNEAHGPSQSAHALATHSISIPLAYGVESLNAAMATGIILYEAVRQSNKM